ncbi:hypothetical protein RIF29_16401 [Crotalaria pallida]|uniref:Uncharacterized protein n=1 Tax=Crotalaria pallida TaxID=3830 RepID=A0AAN9IEF3_CROPI
MPHSTHDQNQGIEKVSDLINEDLWCWKRDIVYQAFSNIEANYNLSIQLQRSVTMDRMIRDLKKDDEYSARSSCRVTLNQHAKFEASSSSVGQNLNWKNPQKVSCMPRVKDLLPVTTQEKLDFDASLGEGARIGGGLVICDHYGAILAMATRRTREVLDLM